MGIEIDAPGPEQTTTAPQAVIVATIPKELESDRGSLVVRARELRITNQATFDEGCELQKVAATLEKKIEAHYEPMRVAARAALDTILDSKKRDLTPVLEVKQLMSRATATFQVEQERIRQEKQRRDQEEADRLAEEQRKRDLAEAKKEGATKKELEAIKTAPLVVSTPAVEPTYEKPAGVSKPIEDWSAEVQGDKGLMELAKAVVAGKQPVIAIQPNQKYLDQQARSLKGLLNIPGVKAKVEYRTSTRTKGGF